jgi:hypothetical protein
VAMFSPRPYATNRHYSVQTLRARREIRPGQELLRPKVPLVNSMNPMDLTEQD